MVLTVQQKPATTSTSQTCLHVGGPTSTIQQQRPASLSSGTTMVSPTQPATSLHRASTAPAGGAPTSCNARITGPQPVDVSPNASGPPNLRIVLSHLANNSGFVIASPQQTSLFLRPDLYDFEIIPTSPDLLTKQRPLTQRQTSSSFRDADFSTRSSRYVSLFGHLFLFVGLGLCRSVCIENYIILIVCRCELLALIVKLFRFFFSMENILFSTFPAFFPSLLGPCHESFHCCRFICKNVSNEIWSTCSG